MDASFAQTAFTGGEWGANVQGRFDDPKYKAGLNVCLNAIPLEEGAWTRRPGVQFAGFTRRGSFARAYTFAFSSLQPYTMEFTGGHVRFWNGTSLVLDAAPIPVVSISSGSPAILTTGAATTWATGDSLQVFLADQLNVLTCAYLSNRQFVATKIDTTHFSLADQFGNPIDGSQFNLGATVATVGRILDLTTPWTTSAQIRSLVFAQSEQQMLVFCPNTQTQLITASFGGFNGQGNESWGFSIANAPFKDGPYLDPPTDHSSVQSSGVSGSVTLTFSASQGFTSANVGQMVRLFSQPVPWNTSTGYSPPDAVTYNGVYYQCIKPITAGANPPDVAIYEWAEYPSGAQWCYAVITAVTSNTQVTATLFNIPQPPGPQIVVTPVPNPLLYTHDSSNPITTYQMGLYWGTIWPTCGTYAKGRFWFAGSIANRADAGMVNNNLVCSPTTYDGTPADDNGLSLLFNFPETLQIQWMHPNHLGVVVGAVSGEVLIRASQLGDPITPTSVDAEEVTYYGCADVQPTLVGYSLLIVQRYARKVLDFAASIFTGRHSGYNASLTAKHLTTDGVEEIAYQRETAPVLWCRTGNAAQFIGMTYKREDSYQLQGPQIAGWHRHTLGSGYTTQAICTGPSESGSIDTLGMVTQNPATQAYHMEFLTPIFDVDTSYLCANFMDASIQPVSMLVAADSSSVTLYGFWHAVGSTITAFIGGLDCGDYVVQSNGSITVPFAPTNTFQPLFTLAYLNSITGQGCNQVNLISNVAYTTPAFLTQPAVQSYMNASLSGGNEWCGAIDSANNRIFSTGPSNAQTYLTSYNFTTGVVNNYTNNTGALGPSIPFQSAVTLDPSGNIWTVSSTGGGLYELIPGSVWATGITNISANFGDRISHAWQQVGMVGYLCSGFFSDPSADTTQVRVFSISAGVASPYGTYQNTGGTTTVTAGRPGSGLFYWTVQPFSIYGTAYSLGVSSVNGGALSNATIASYVPTNFDASWSAFTHFSGVAYDQTDGNLIIGVGGSGGGNPQYIAKLRASDGSILWKTAVADANGFSDQGITNSVIKYGTFYYFASTTDTFYSINTATGVATTHVSTGGLSGGGSGISVQSSNDVLGCIIGNAVWNTANGALTLLNSTPSSGGSLAAVYLANAGTPFGPNIVASIPAGMGFTYNSDGQLLRPQEPPEVGTQNGPALGKTRRGHMYAMQFVQTTPGCVSVGTNFSSIFPAKFTSTKRPEQGTYLPVTQLYTDIWWNTLSDDYSFDGMLCWRISRPYPCTIAAVEMFIQGQDR